MLWYNFSDTVICFRLKPTETCFLAEYRDVMKPLAQALDILQAEKKAYMGHLLPTLTIQKLWARREVIHTCGPLVDTLLAGIARCFEATLCDAESCYPSPQVQEGLDWTSVFHQVWTTMPHINNNEVQVGAHRWKRKFSCCIMVETILEKVWQLPNNPDY